MHNFPQIAPQYYFRLANGRIVKKIDELPHVLNSLNDSVFESHVTPHKNDFARWIFDVYRLDSLSNELGEVKSKEEMVRILNAYGMSAQANPRQAAQQPKPQPAAQQPKPQPAVQQPKPQPAAQQPKPQPTSTAASPVQPSAVAQVAQQGSQAKPSAPAQEQPASAPKQPSAPSQSKVAAGTKVKRVYAWKTEHTKLADAEPRSPETPDDFFRKNPVIIEHNVQARQKDMTFEPLKMIGDVAKEKAAAIYKDGYSDAYRRMSDLRKAGYDTALIEIMLMRIPAKIKIFETSMDEKDSLKVRRYLNEAIEELNNVK